MTRARRMAIEILAEASAPLTVQQFHALITSRLEADPSTSYRLVHDLVELGVLKAVRLPHQLVPSYAVHLPEAGGDYITCTECGALTWLDDLAEIRALEQRLARQMHFRGLSHELHLVGLCAECTNLTHHTP